MTGYYAMGALDVILERVAFASDIPQNGRDIMNLSILLTFFAVGGFVGDVLDFALNKLRAKNVAADLWVVASTSEWSSASIFTAIGFSKQYLDRIFGLRVWSFRAWVTCFAIALLTTTVTLSLVPGFSTAGRGFFLGAIGFVALFYACIDFVSIAWSRNVLGAILDSRGGSRKLSKRLFLLCTNAYLAMGLGWCLCLTFYMIIGLHSLLGVIFLPFQWILWLPMMIVASALKLADPALFFALVFPGAFSTLVLIVTIAVPILLVSTKRYSKPMAVRLLDNLASAPLWVGKGIGLVCGGALGLAHHFTSVK